MNRIVLATPVLLSCLTAGSVPRENPWEHEISRLFAMYRGAPQKLAVIPYRNERGDEPLLSRLLYSRISRRAIEDRRFTLVARDEIGSILKEISFQSTGLVADETRARLGKLTGANAILVYSIRDSFVDMRIISVETGKVLAIGDLTVSAEAASVLEAMASSHRMVRLAAGNFLMGAPAEAVANGPDVRDAAPQVRVFISKPFLLDAFEVTNAEYRVCVQSGVCSDSVLDRDPAFNADRQPVLGVTWHDANGYCQFVGKRLPTEAEWEYGARAGTQTLFYWGNKRTGAATYENIRPDNSFHAPSLGPVPVGTRKPNPWGLYDMLGNAPEFVADYYDPNRRHLKLQRTDPVSNGSNAFCKTYHIIRGGSWFDGPMPIHIRRFTPKYMVWHYAGLVPGTHRDVAAHVAETCNPDFPKHVSEKQRARLMLWQSRTSLRDLPRESQDNYVLAYQWALDPDEVLRAQKPCDKLRSDCLFRVGPCDSTAETSCDSRAREQLGLAPEAPPSEEAFRVRFKRFLNGVLVAGFRCAKH